jgi:hypothetical protein
MGVVGSWNWNPFLFYDPQVIASMLMGLRLTGLPPSGSVGSAETRKGVEMAKFIAGLILGTFLSLAATSWAAGVFGTGTLSGWSVVKDGDEVCSDPDVDTSSKEIECD